MIGGEERIVSFYSVIIASNSVLIGLEIEVEASSPFDESPLSYRWTQHAFALIFLAELMARIAADGPKCYFFGWKDWWWHY